MKFAKWTFLIAGIYGLLALVPMYFTLPKYGADHPPAVNHLEFYFGFVGVAIAFQVVFLIISRDPVRYRAMMIPSVIEKYSFLIAGCVLFGRGMLNSTIFIASLIDGLLGSLFIVSFILCGRSRN